jgi:mRNA-degrading endonuclease toxin of MazEF toxin-antitoxin module
VDRAVNRSDIWLAQVGRKTRPVLVLTRPQVIEVRTLVCVAEITTTIRGHAAEVELDLDDAGLDRPSVVNCDGLHTIARSSLTRFVSSVDEQTMNRVCGAISYALGC